MDDSARRRRGAPRSALAELAPDVEQHDERDEQQAEHEHRRGATARERKREATQDVDMGLSGQCEVYRPRLRLLRLPKLLVEGTEDDGGTGAGAPATPP